MVIVMVTWIDRLLMNIGDRDGGGDGDSDGAHLVMRW